MMNPEQQLQDLETRFGTSANIVYVTLHMTHYEVEQYFGPQCEDYEPLCGCCRAWIEWHTNHQHKVTVSIDRKDIIKLLNG